MTAGGEATWRNYLTLPNILKEFNPGLKGYSVGKGEFLAPNSHMNVAFPVSADYDAYKQAQFLVKKMKRDPDVDFKNDWKVNAQCPPYAWSQKHRCARNFDSRPFAPRVLRTTITLRRACN